MAASVVVSTELGTSSEEDFDSFDEHDDSDHEEMQNGESVVPQKKGLADVMASILQKKTPTGKNVILAKAKTDKQLHQLRKRKANEEEGVVKSVKKTKDEESTDSESDDPKKRQKSQRLKFWEEIGRIKPDVRDRENERNLQKIATRGVVQLFNAVKQQQKTIDEKLTEVGSSERKREKVIKSMTKGKFLDVLKETGTNVTSDPGKAQEKKEKKKVTKSKPEDGEEPSWNILRDDFMMGASMKDWDKDSSDDDDDGDNEVPNTRQDSDSDS